MDNNDKMAELKRRMDADDPAALYEYAELVRASNRAEAYKYTVLAAQLGNPAAMECMGDDCIANGDVASAVRYYKSGAKAGLLDCTVKLAILKLDVNESAAAIELEELAQMGVASACIALSNYHKAKGHKKQSAYWRSILK